MRKAFLRSMLLISIFLVTSCGGGNGGGNGGGGTTATLQWTTPATDIENSSITISGYKIYYGTESGVYTTVVDVGMKNQYTVSGLSPGKTYYFAITAYSSDGVESDPTDEQAKTL